MSAKKDVMEPQMVRMSAELLARIDEARRQAPDLPTRPEIIRRMLTEWLDQHKIGE
ncbi:ribbon-helix-helix protein, CopG family [Donghicola eburneus]|uniref:ribbon-helix-helix protein, CopG family n=1 Tax=Donghicola eburneus TaxID=393278 RepID=UPI0008F302AA|nr:ribbon-helix-helix protein, CopG family [Donghicola eburneus]SFQ79692.1 Ribbon-helix-helix protein, copG family [Donghicola eburneus]